MAVFKLARANLTHRKLRSAISMLAVGVGTALLLVLVGMTNGTLREVAQRMRGVGADIIVHTEDMNPVIDSFAPLREELGPHLLKIEGVKAVCPVVLGGMNLGGHYQRVFGVVLDEFRAVGAKVRILTGREWKEPNEILIDQRLAATGFDVGDEVQKLGLKLRICGVCGAANGARVLMPRRTLQDLRAEEHRVSFFFVKCKSPDDVQRVATEIEKRFHGLKLKTLLLNEYAQALEKSFRGLHEFMAGVISVCLFISFLVVLLAMYTTILERTREIGILKSMGAGRLFIVRWIVAESLVLCFGGSMVGILLAVSAKLLLKHFLPLLTVTLSPGWLAMSVLIAVAGGCLGALYPAIRAAVQDPVVSLLYE